MTRDMSAAAVQKTISQLADPDVNTAVELASTINVARNIIRALPGVKRLRRGGPEARKGVLALLQKPATLADDNLSAISVEVLEAYPSNDVKVALAKPIAERRWHGINSILAAETFLKILGIKAERKDALARALIEARKIYPVTKTPKMSPAASRPTAPPTRRKTKTRPVRRRAAAKK